MKASKASLSSFESIKASLILYESVHFLGKVKEVQIKFLPYSQDFLKKERSINFISPLFIIVSQPDTMRSLCSQRGSRDRESHRDYRRDDRESHHYHYRRDDRDREYQHHRRYRDDDHPYQHNNSTHKRPHSSFSPRRGSEQHHSPNNNNNYSREDQSGGAAAYKRRRATSSSGREQQQEGFSNKDRERNSSANSSANPRRGSEGNNNDERRRRYSKSGEEERSSRSIGSNSPSAAAAGMTKKGQGCCSRSVSRGSRSKLSDGGSRVNNSDYKEGRRNSNNSNNGLRYRSRSVERSRGESPVVGGREDENDT